MVSKTEQDLVIKIIGENLLKGYTLLDGYCDVCASPLMKRKNEDSFCVYCNDVKRHKPEPVVKMESSPVKPMELTIGTMNGTSNLSQTLSTVRDVATHKLSWSAAALKDCNDIEQCIKLNQLIQSTMDTLERALKLSNSQ